MDQTALAASLRGHIAHHLGNDDVVLVVGGTADLEKGTHTVGVARRHSGTAGRIENRQVAVYLAYTTPHAHPLVDHRLWADDTDRLTTATVPAGIGLATKIELAPAP